MTHAVLSHVSSTLLLYFSGGSEDEAKMRISFPFVSESWDYEEAFFFSCWISFLSHDAVLGLMLLSWEENLQF